MENLSEKITHLLNEGWKGKKFVYRSKYGGEVIGEIESVFIHHSFIMDAGTANNLAESIATKTPKGNRKGQEPNLVEVKPEDRYTAIRPQVSIRSTKGQVYELNEIFIMSKTIFGNA